MYSSSWVLPGLGGDWGELVSDWGELVFNCEFNCEWECGEGEKIACCDESLFPLVEVWGLWLGVGVSRGGGVKEQIRGSGLGGGGGGRGMRGMKIGRVVREGKRGS